MKNNNYFNDVKFLFFILLVTIIFSLSIKKNIETLVSSISGIVVKGEGKARKYGYRTANMEIKENLDCGIFNGDSNYGKTTIFSNGNGFVECHIHNFNKDIYGKKLKIKNIDHVNHSKLKKKRDCSLAKMFTA